MEDEQPQPEPAGQKCFQILGDDLAALEEMLPELMSFRQDLHTARQKIKWRRVIEIISNVRWNYGPPLQCFRIEADDSGEDSRFD